MANHKEKEELFNKESWKNCTYVEKWKLVPILYHIYKITFRRIKNLNTKCKIFNIVRDYLKL